MRAAFISISILLITATLLLGLFWSPGLWLLIILVPLFVLGVYDIFQHKHTLWRNFPVFGHIRWIMESIRPFLRQYFFESETDGAPINRMHRSVIYQRAKGHRDTIPYGTKLNTQEVGYEWIGHSIAAKSHESMHPTTRILIGGTDCKKPYSASILNISAMSFGALSKNAILALNKGAAAGGFYHNTGEGSVTEYHLRHNADLVWQIGTSYFGCRDHKGYFNPGYFKKIARHKNIKMIEIKLSQGAKPGHGGILPASKNTPEISRIRLIEAGTEVVSPPDHSAFSTPIEMMNFIQTLRELSGGKPIGFKLAIGRSSEFVALCKAMVETRIRPDFITVDGGEGGTGAAPLEYSNSVGMPLRDALAFVHDVLTGFNLRKEVRVIASGKVFTGFELVKNFALGADICNSARGMMMALGCVQALQCNTNHCPTGITTQNKRLVKGLHVDAKAKRVARFHQQTVIASMEIIASAGLRHTEQLNRSHIYRRISEMEIKRFDEIYYNLSPGALLETPYPEKFIQAMQESTSNSFFPKQFVAETEQGLQEVI